jgi:pimeloyl-ACP methyl ester carboxylesterase
VASPSQHYFQSQRLRLSYWSWGAVGDPGDETSPPLIFVHGTRDHSRSWDRIANEFTADHTVVAYDLRGHGDSQWVMGGHYGITEHVVDLVALIDVLGGRATVVAHSLGGLVATLTAGLFPDHFEKLVAIEGAGERIHRRPLATPKALREWAVRTRGYDSNRPREYDSIEAGAARMREVNAQLSPGLAHHLATHGMRQLDEKYVWKFDHWMGSSAPVEIRDEEARVIWGDVSCPVLLIMGAESYERGQHLPRHVSRFPDAQSVVVPDAGHWVHHDQPHAVVEAIKHFL